MSRIFIMIAFASLLRTSAWSQEPGGPALAVVASVKAGTLTGDAAVEVLQSQRRELDAQIATAPDAWALYDVRGQVQAAVGQYAGAARDYQAAIDAYRRAPPHLPDPHIAFVFSRRAEVQFERLGALDPAIDTLLDGQRMLGELVERIEVVRGGRSGAAWEEVERTVRAAQESVNRALLTALLEQPGRRDEALAAFATALAVLPDDYEVRMRYAELLIREQRWADAVSAFKTATVLRPDASRPWCRIPFAGRPLLSELVGAGDKSGVKHLWEDLRSAGDRCLASTPGDSALLTELLLGARVMENTKDERYYQTLIDNAR